MSIIVCHVFFLSILYVVHIDRRFENLCRCAPSRWLQTQIESRCVRNDWFGRRGVVCVFSAQASILESTREKETRPVENLGRGNMGGTHDMCTTADFMIVILLNIA